MHSNPPIHIRPAAQQDAADIADVHRQSVHRLAAQNYEKDILDAWAPPVDDDRISVWADLISDHQVFVAHADATLIGFSAFIVNEQELRAVYVHPDWTRRSVGTLLLQMTEQQARRHNVDELHLASSLNAVDFYKHHGYSIDKRGTMSLDSDTEMNCVFMSKNL